MSTKTKIKLGPIKFTRIGKTSKSLFAPFGNVTKVHFSSKHGEVSYYDDEVKWTKETQLRLHKDIADAAAGLNSGWFIGLDGSSTMSGNDIYVQASHEYRLLTAEEAKDFI